MFLNWMPSHLFVLSFKTCTLTVMNVIFLFLVNLSQINA